ncbi:hypothetical protein L209DRAFT_479251 [Thermothelomyces heterothallicus CBS 203.75]
MELLERVGGRVVCFDLLGIGCPGLGWVWVFLVYFGRMRRAARAKMGIVIICTSWVSSATLCRASSGRDVLLSRAPKAKF